MSKKKNNKNEMTAAEKEASEKAAEEAKLKAEKEARESEEAAEKAAEEAKEAIQADAEAKAAAARLEDQKKVSKAQVKKTLEKQAKKSESEYVIAKKKALTTLRGTLGEGEQVFPNDFSRGTLDFELHMKGKVIVKRGEEE